MELESDIKKVLQDYRSISSTARSEEARIESVNAEIKLLENRIRVESTESSEFERQRMQNLVSYQSSLIARAESRTELFRALHEDLLGLFIRRKQLRNSVDAGGVSVNVVPNLSNSELSSGDEQNQAFPNNCSIMGSINITTMADDQNVEEETTADQTQLPFGLKLLQINVNEDACLTPEGGSDYDDLQYKDNILDNLTMSILDPNADVNDIFKEAINNSSLPCEEFGGSEEVNRNSARQLTVDFDEIGNPTGPNAGAFKRTINSYVCQLLPIRFKQIGEIPIEDYKSVFNALTDKFCFDINKSYTRKKMSSCYRQHKYKLLVQVKKDHERGTEPQKPSYVNEEDWNAFVAKTKDEEFDKISKKNKASRSQQSALNRKGLPSAVRKRKLKGSDQGPGLKMQNPKRGHPGTLLAAVKDNQNEHNLES